MDDTPDTVRLQKFLASAGVGSRRMCEELIVEGRVTVNGQTVTKLPVLVQPDQDLIRVDGRKIRPSRLLYFVLHKPKGVLCTNQDPAGRPRAVDLLPRMKERVFPVGRLDASSTGLLLLTNDGELAERMTHPRYGIEKTYEAVVVGRPEASAMEQLREGIWLAEGKTRSARIRLIRRGRLDSKVEIKLREGRNRQVRRMLAKVGHKVIRLKRTRLGPLTLSGLKPGKFRSLSSTEIKSLYTLCFPGENLPGLKKHTHRKRKKR